MSNFYIQPTPRATNDGYVLKVDKEKGQFNSCYMPSFILRPSITSNDFNNPYQPTQQQPLASPFISSGFINPVDIDNPQLHAGFFDFKNFMFNQKTDTIGQGAFADVYRSRHLKSYGQTYAIKHIVKQHLIECGEKEENVFREIRTQMSFNHPNIVKMYTYHNTRNDIFMVMEDMVGGTLFERIQARGRFKEDEAFRYFIQVLNGVYFLHKNGYVHRDIKPENLLFDSGNKIKLCDFGWCVQAGPANPRKSFCGTAEYMAPEIIKSQPYAQSVDIWALGVLLFELLHGYSPFHDDALAETEDGQIDYKPVYRRILHLSYRVDPSLRISKECEDLIRQLLNPDNCTRINAGQIFTHPWIRKYEGVNLNSFLTSSQTTQRRSMQSPIQRTNQQQTHQTKNQTSHPNPMVHQYNQYNQINQVNQVNQYNQYNQYGQYNQVNKINKQYHQMQHRFIPYPQQHQHQQPSRLDTNYGNIRTISIPKTNQYLNSSYDRINRINFNNSNKNAAYYQTNNNYNNYITNNNYLNTSAYYNRGNNRLIR